MYIGIQVSLCERPPIVSKNEDIFLPPLHPHPPRITPSTRSLSVEEIERHNLDRQIKEVKQAIKLGLENRQK